ncbi:MAG: GNAT family N-acetyltransferase [Bacteroidales bacterium]|nr:GNAT family N-acetyltransferase [Bacteroidales bacterium]
MTGKFDIRIVDNREEIPFDLLYLADPSKEQIEKYIYHSALYEACINNKIIGCYVLSQINNRTIEIKNIAVAKEYQKQGIGKLLLKDAIKRSKSKGSEIIVICTGNSSLDQLYLYQKAGFRITDIIKDYFVHNYKERIWENGIQCKDRLVLTLDLKDAGTEKSKINEDFHISPVKASQKNIIKSFITDNWGSHMVVSKGQVHNVSDLPGFIAIKGGEITGLITYRIYNKECEIVTLDSRVRNLGLGTQLISKVIAAAKNNNCTRVWLVTTNDNIQAIRFYQKRDFVWTGFHRNAIESYRKIKPEIPELGNDHIPIKHEIEFEYLIG